MDRVTVLEAAEILRISQRAGCKRIKPETTPWDNEAEGWTYVHLDASETCSGIREDRSSGRLARTVPG